MLPSVNLGTERSERPVDGRATTAPTVKPAVLNDRIPPPARPDGGSVLVREHGGELLGH
jgi:hypothetical protein